MQEEIYDDVYAKNETFQDLTNQMQSNTKIESNGICYMIITKNIFLLIHIFV